MSGMGVFICIAIAASAALGVYLRLRQMATVAGNRTKCPPISFGR